MPTLRGHVGSTSSDEFWKIDARIKFLLVQLSFSSSSMKPHLPPTPPTDPSSSMNMAQRGTRAVETNGTTPGLEQKPHTIIAIAGVRVYYSKLQLKDKTQWNYSGWKGTLTLGRDIDTPQSTSEGKAGKNWFRLADDESGSTIWKFKFPENFEYQVDQSFLHVFQGKVNPSNFHLKQKLKMWISYRVDATDFSLMTMMKPHYLGRRLWTKSTVLVSAQLYIRISWTTLPDSRVQEDTPFEERPQQITDFYPSVDDFIACSRFLQTPCTRRRE